MICCLDVHYDEDGDEAVTAAVLFPSWTSSQPSKVAISRRTQLEPYEPGQFYRRELPCLLQALQELSQRPSLILIDGYVWLDNFKPGLGAHLYEALEQTTPVAGVAKSEWHGLSRFTTVRRGNSARTLWITVAGISLAEAAEGVASMHGPFRLPNMVKLADSLCRRPWLAS